MNFINSGKTSWKNVVICLVLMFQSRVSLLELSRKVHLLQCCANLSKKSKSIEAICIYTFEISRFALSENGIVYYAMASCFRDIRI